MSGRPYLKCDETIFLSIKTPSTRKKTPKGKSETVNRRTNHTLSKRKKTKEQTDLQNITQKTDFATRLTFR